MKVSVTTLNIVIKPVDIAKTDFSVSKERLKRQFWQFQPTKFLAITEIDNGFAENNWTSWNLFTGTLTDVSELLIVATTNFEICEKTILETFLSIEPGQHSQCSQSQQ